MAQTREISYEDDEEMQQLLEKKRKQEEAELFNAPETMAKKRKAVREAAKFTLAPQSSTDLDFDDDVELAELEPDRGTGEVGSGVVKLEQQESQTRSLVSQVGEEEAEVDKQELAAKQTEMGVKEGLDEAQVEQRHNKVDDGGLTKAQFRARVKKQRRNRKRAERAERVQREREEKKSQKKSPRKTATLPIVRLDPEEVARKSKTAVRRARYKLRRLLQQQEELLSSQLQAV